MDLELKTRQYWQISLAARGKIESRLKVCDSLQQTGDLLGNLNPARRLWGHIAYLQDQIIAHGGVKVAKKPKQPLKNLTKLSS